MKGLFRFFLAAAFFFGAAQAAGGGEALRLEHLPRAVKQGDAVLVRAAGPAALQSVYGEMGKERFPLAGGPREGTYLGLLGVDLESRPAAYEVKVVAADGAGKTLSATLQLKVEKSDFKTQTLTLPPSMVELDPKTLERVNRESQRMAALFREVREEGLWRGAFLRPVAGEVTSAFGLRRVINGQPKSPHSGVDIRAEQGTPVSASNAGTAALVDDFFFSGKSVILDHGWGLYSMYFHLSETLVRPGDRVPRGAVIGRVGSTGRSTAPHLHWGVKIRGARVDPLSLLDLSPDLRP